MEIIIDVLSLSVDQSIRKIKALKADSQIIEFKVVIRRKQSKFKLNKKRAKIPKNQHVQLFKSIAFPIHIGRRTQKVIEMKRKLIFCISCNNRIASESIVWASEHRTHLNVQADLIQIITQKEEIQGENYGNEAKDDPVFSQLKDKCDYQTQNELKGCHKLFEAKQQYSKGNYEISISILTNLLVQQQPIHMKAYMTLLLANSYYRMKNFQQSLRYYSLEYPQENPKHKVMRKSNLGALYFHLNQHQESLRNYTAALKIYNECGCFEMDLSNTYYNIGNIYLREGMYETAAKYFQIALEGKKSKGEERGAYYAAFKLGMTRRLEGKYEQSLKSLFYALNFAQNGVGDILDLYKQIAQVYEKIHKPNQSLSYYQLICDSSHSSDEDKGYGYENAARIYFELNRKQESERFLRIAEQYYKKGKNVKKAQKIESKQSNKLGQYQMETD